MIRPILYTVQQFIARTHYMQRAYILRKLNFFCSENILMQNKDQPGSTSNEEYCKYYVL